MKIGQIQPDSNLGGKIADIVRLESVRVVVEIGTWNGMGSTRCIVEGLKSKKNEYSFQSYECWEDMFREAVSNNEEYISDKFEIILGKLINEDEIFGWFDVGSLTKDQEGWLRQDIARMKMVKNVFDIVPSEIDLLVLDGGEFSTYKEWQKLKDRTRYLVLDDTRTMKGLKIREEIIKSNFRILDDCLSDRNGYLICDMGR